MKTSIISSLACSLLFIVAGCSNKSNLDDMDVAPVKVLYEPADNKAVVLQPSASAAVYFEWEPALASGALPLYEIVFDKESGDFSQPVYRMSSDGNGSRNYVTVTHKDLNRIGAMMGIGSAETGKFKWTAFSSLGLKDMPGQEVRTIEITRLAGFADVPVDVFVTGAGSEGGTDVTKAAQMKAISPGEFEVYTKLTAGQPVFFTDKKAEGGRHIYTDNNVLKEDATGTVQVNKTAVYKITADFNTGAATYTEVESIGLWFCPNNTIQFYLDYVGYGVWKATSQPITFKQEGWGRDQRYKFRMMSGGVESEWGPTINGLDGAPGGQTDYFYMKNNLSVNQWDNKWKFATEMDGALVDITFYLQAGGPYKHQVDKVGMQ